MVKEQYLLDLNQIIHHSLEIRVKFLNVIHKLIYITIYKLKILVIQQF